MVKGKNSIYNITEDYQALIDAIEDQDGYITEEQELALKNIEDCVDHKIRMYVNIINREKNRLDIIRAEKARLDKIKKSSERTIDHLKSILSWALHTYGNISKSGTLSFDLGDVKVYTRNTTFVRFDDNQVNKLMNRILSDGLSDPVLEDMSDYIQADIQVRVPANRIKDVIDNFNYLEISSYETSLHVDKNVLKDLIKAKVEDFTTNFIEAYMDVSESVIIK